MKLICDGVVTQKFSTAHPAVDMALNGGGKASYGQPLYAPEAGKITYVGQMGSGALDAGTVVQLSSTDGTNVHRLCHMIPGSAVVSVGQQVRQGQLLGKMGWSGYVIPANIEGTHCHWVMERNGVRVNALDYVNEGGDMKADLDLVRKMAQVVGGRIGYASRPNNDGSDLNAHVGKDAGQEFLDWYWSDEAKAFRDGWLPSVIKFWETYKDKVGQVDTSNVSKADLIALQTELAEASKQVDEAEAKLRELAK